MYKILTAIGLLIGICATLIGVLGSLASAGLFFYGIYVLFMQSMAVGFMFMGVSVGGALATQLAAGLLGMLGGVVASWASDQT